MTDQSFIFSAEVWLWTAENGVGWHFVSVPEDESELIREFFSTSAKGFGSFPVDVTVGNTTWKTSIFPESKTGLFMLPLKAAVRKAEKIQIDDNIEVSLRVLV